MNSKHRSVLQRLEAIIYKLESGFSLVELVIYVALLSILLVSLLLSINLMLRSWREAQGRTKLANAGSAAMERLVHEIREATSINSGGSTFATTTGSLELNGTDSFGNATTTTFSVASGMLKVAQGTASSSALLPSDVGVTAFTLYQISTGNSYGVRVVLGLQTATTTKTVSATFYDTTVLRGSY